MNTHKQINKVQQYKGIKNMEISKNKTKKKQKSHTRKTGNNKTQQHFKINNGNKKKLRYRIL